MTRRISIALPLLALAGVAVVAGCGTQQRGAEQSKSGYSWPMTNTTTAWGGEPSTAAATGSAAGREAARGAPVRQEALSRELTDEFPGGMDMGDAAGKARSSAMRWTSMAYPTGDAKTSVLGIDKGMPGEVRVNQAFDYELKIKNLTKNTLQNVILTEAPSGNIKLSGLSPQGRADANGALNWALGNLAPGETKTVRASGMAGAEGQVGTCTSITYNPQLCSVVPVVSPKLVLTKAGPAEVSKCDEAVYNYEVKNTGTGTVCGIKIKQNLPEGLLTASGERMVSKDIGCLNAGQSKTFKMSVNPQRTGTFDLMASAEADGMSVNSNRVTTVVREPVLRITQNCVDTQFINRPVKFEITVTNTGDGAAREVVIEDSFPSGVEAVASDRGRISPGKATWSIGTLQPRESRTVTLSLSPKTAGNFASQATVRGVCAATPVSASCATSVTGIPAILLEVVDTNDPIEVGDTTTYVITVTNQGSAPDTDIRIVCTLEASQEYVSSTGATTSNVRGRQVAFDPIRSLAAKQKATYRVVVRGTAEDRDVRFKVSMTSSNLGNRPVEETEATNIYQ